ncbi:MAG: outer membrane lipoprotein-sorting protein [Spirochaetales bacterium]|nr:outer membrane lipoprotein-sorting protein [Spirochaetales bacterium]
MNKLYKRIAVKLVFSFLFGSTLWALPTGSQILAAIDRQQEMSADITAKVKITQQKVDQGVRILQCVFYRRDRDDAFLIVMTAPDNEKGNGYLSDGDNMYMYRRNTRTFQHVGRDENIGGSDASMGDMESRKYTELYRVAKDAAGKEIIVEETLGSANIPVYRIEVIAKVSDVKYPKQVMWVTRDKYLVLKVDSYSLSGTLMETAYFTQYTVIQGRYIPLWQKFIDRFEEGNMSIVELSGISLNRIDDYVFTKPYLENLSK